jgi:tetratricopeptide (TPR) repeat protein
MLVGGAAVGLAALAHITEIANKLVEAYLKTLEAFFPYCEGRPIEELRGTMERNLNTGGDRYSAAQQQAQKLLACRKDDPGALNVLGAVDFYTGDYSKAEQYFRRAIKGAPSNSSMHMNFADTLVELGRYEAALDEYRRLDDGSVRILYKLARTYLLSANYAEARHLLAQIPTDYGEEAKPGKARILEAAALSALAGRAGGPAKDGLLAAAKQSFNEGVAKDRTWWIEVLADDKQNRYEPFTKVAVLFGGALPSWLAEAGTR